MDRKQRTNPFVVGVAVAAAAVLLVAEWPRVQNWYRPPAAGLPPADDIVEMRAAVWAAGSRGYFESDIPEFAVPDPTARRLWRRLDPHVPVTDPPAANQEPLGELAVTTHDGRVARVRFYETGTDDLLFTPDGKHFFRSEPRNAWGIRLGGGLLLAGTLRHASNTAEPAAE